MKKITLTILLASLMSVVIISCDRYSKENRTVNRLEGTWDVTDFKLKLNGKDTSLVSAKRVGELFFDNCADANDSNKCSVAFTIKGDKLANDLYYPMGYEVYGKTKMLLFWMNKKYYFNIKKIKGEELELTGTDSLYSADNSNLIKAKKK